jgi:hypothetical protein
VGVGIAALAIGRERVSRLDRARNKATELIDSAAEQAKPWMGWAAGGAGAATALAVYAGKRRKSGWQRASGGRREMAVHTEKQPRRWSDLAISTAIALASAASSRKGRRRGIRASDENTAETIKALTEKGAQLLQRVRNISDEARHLYPSIRRVLA